MFNVKDKVVFITGGTSGIGLASAGRLVQAGARVVISGRRDSGAAIADDIGATFVRLDVTDESSLVAALEQVAEKFGPLDILFNNAGAENTGPSIEESGAAEFQRQLDINLLAAYNVLHHAGPRLAEGASVINTASAAGMLNMPGYGQYSATKAALISLTKTAALELAPRGIRVNAICPGSIWTEMLPPDHPEVALVKVVSPSQRIGDAEEVAALVHFLGCDESRYISGAIVPIDGGLSAGFGYPLLGAVINSLEA